MTSTPSLNERLDKLANSSRLNREKVRDILTDLAEAKDAAQEFIDEMEATESALDDLDGLMDGDSYPGISDDRASAREELAQRISSLSEAHDKLVGVDWILD